MFNTTLFYKLILFDYLILLNIVLPVFLYNKNYQNLDKKLIKILIWFLLGLPVTFLFFLKLNLFFKNIYIFIFFILINSITIYIYYEKIQIILSKKKDFSFFFNKSFSFNEIIIYFFIIILQIFIFII